MTEQDELKQRRHDNHAEELRREDAKMRQGLVSKLVDNVYDDVVNAQEQAARKRDRDLIQILESRGFMVRPQNRALADRDKELIDILTSRGYIITKIKEGNAKEEQKENKTETTS